MVSQLLHAAGLCLGPAADLIPPNPNNPQGFWENRRFTQLNQRLLTNLGGSWDDPPPAPRRWKDRPFVRVRADAHALLEAFATREPWGWNDPRTCLTLPFLRGMLGPISVVIVIRHPLEVAASLERCNGFTTGRSLALWSVYYDRLLEAAALSNQVITHFDAHVENPDRESQRLLSFFGLPVEERTVAAAGSTRAVGLRHHRSSAGDLLAAGVPPRVCDLYDALCQEAGWSSSD